MTSSDNGGIGFSNIIDNGYPPSRSAHEKDNVMSLGNFPVPHFDSPFWLVKPCKSTRRCKLTKNCIRSREEGQADAIDSIVLQSLYQ